MKLQSVKIEGFRGIGSLEMSFDSEMTILLGRNGVGKTTVLDAIASILEPIQLAWPSEHDKSALHSISISAKDKKNGQSGASINLSFRIEKYKKFDDDAYINITSTYEDGFKQTLSKSLEEFWNFTRRGGLADELRPLMVYYRQDRGFEHKNLKIALPTLQETLKTSLQGNLQAISHLQSWWDKHDADEARQVRDKNRNYRDPQLEAIRKVIKEIDGFSSISFSSTADPSGLYFNKSKNESVHVDMLSSGERSFIILIADLARRLQVLHPNLSLHDIPGIVLIDEIELNLHPAWQSKIISTLRRVFKNCQFIISTHSPQVVSSVKSTHVAQLSGDIEGNIKITKPLRTRGQTSNYLLEGVFGSNERYPEIDEMIENFNHAVDNNDLKKASRLYLQISKSIEGDPPELLVFKKRLARLSTKQ